MSIKLFDVLYESETDGITSQSLNRATTLTGICKGIDAAGRLLVGDTTANMCGTGRKSDRSLSDLETMSHNAGC